MKADRNIKKQRRVARSLERAAVPERPFLGRGPRYLVYPYVTAACAPSLLAIATALRDETLVLDEEELKDVKEFITDGASPFFGRDATAAMREAVRLQHSVIGRLRVASPDAQLESSDVGIARAVATTN
jgi:hypothetical protein